MLHLLRLPGWTFDAPESDPKDPGRLGETRGDSGNLGEARGNVYGVPTTGEAFNPCFNHGGAQCLIRLTSLDPLPWQVFTSVSTTIFRTFSCDDDAVEGKSFLRADYSVECSTPKYTVFAIYAGCMILVSEHVFRRACRIDLACSIPPKRWFLRGEDSSVTRG